MASTIVARVHPVVLFAIADAHERRLTVKSKADNKTEVQTRAIGTLLGLLFPYISITYLQARTSAVLLTLRIATRYHLLRLRQSMVNRLLNWTRRTIVTCWIQCCEAHQMNCLLDGLCHIFNKYTTPFRFSTSATFSNFDTDFHDYFHGVVQDSNQSKETMPVLMLTLDALTAHDRLNIHAYLRLVKCVWRVVTLL